MFVLVTALAVGMAADTRPICQNAEARVSRGALYRSDGAADAKRLGDLPPADAILTVLRREDGCEWPVVVRSGIGAPERER